MPNQQKTESLRASLHEQQAEENTLSTEIEGLSIVLRQLENGNAPPSERTAVESQLARLREKRKKKLQEIDELLLELKRIP